MLVLVINCGSSSIKAAVVDSASGRRVRVSVQRLGTDSATLSVDDEDAAPLSARDVSGALQAVLSSLVERTAAAFGGQTIAAVGHRVVHGGETFVAPTRIDDEVEGAIESASSLAPLHNPPNLAGIRAARALLPELPHVAVFDTAFGSTLPSRAKTYALDRELADQHGVRRYGFHGTSHAYVCQQAAGFLGEPVENLKIISCHLGNGASVAAVEFGRCVETSMGMTPLEGLVMGTRSGDIDVGAVLAIARGAGMGPDEIDELLNRRSGLRGLCGRSDLRDIEAAAADGDDACRLAIRVFGHRLRKYIGAYAATMGGVDAVVFTAGIGENSASMRHIASQRLEFLGARLDEDRNRGASVGAEDPVVEISQAHSRTKLLVVATDEVRAIAEQAAALALDADAVNTPKPIPIAVSARHIHLTQESVEALFGPGATLTPRNELSQPGQFACEETLTVVGPKRNLEGVRVLGPIRSKNQIEVSRTDEFWLGVDAPVRRSGDVADSPGVTLEGPHGSVQLSEGLICAARHIHMTPADAEAYGVASGDIVEVAIDSPGRDLVFGDVLIRVSEKYALEMHIDTDEANAAELARHAEGLLVATQGTARLKRKQVRTSETGVQS